MVTEKHLWVGSNLIGSESLAKELGYLYGTAFRDPDWDQIHNAVKQMNGIDLNELTLSHFQKGSIMVGGGNNGRFIVTYFPDGDSSFSSLTLTDLSLTGPDIELTIQTPTEFPAKMCVNLSLVLKVLRYFFLFGEIPKDVQWEVDNTGREATWL